MSTSSGEVKKEYIKRSDPPLVSFRVTNPITYIKIWWQKVMKNEGVDFRFHIRPVTAILITSIVAGFAFGIGRASVFSYFPFLNNILPTNTPRATVIGASPSPTPNENKDWVDTALTGTLKYTPGINKYYLLTRSSTAITLQFNNQIDLTKYVEKRILASGSYNEKTHILIITDVLDLEVLPQSPVPVVTPSPTPITTAEPTPIVSPSPNEASK